MSLTGHLTACHVNSPLISGFSILGFIDIGHCFVSEINCYYYTLVNCFLIILPKPLLTSLSKNSTGRCKSALHGFMERIIGKVQERVLSADLDHNIPKSQLANRTIILPHCTRDKFGEIMANNGGRIYALFDELVSFFSTMNMYSSSKATVQDNREYQDFLKMFTGKAKTRETGKLPTISMQNW